MAIYGNVPDLIAYAAARGVIVVDNSDTLPALQRASDYIRARYVLRFLDELDGTEPVLEEATYIATLPELDTPGFWTKTFTPSQQKVLTQAEGFRWETSSMSLTGDAWDSSPVSPLIDSLLMPYSRYGMPAVTFV